MFGIPVASGFLTRDWLVAGIVSIWPIFGAFMVLMNRPLLRHYLDPPTVEICIDEEFVTVTIDGKATGVIRLDCIERLVERKVDPRKKRGCAIVAVIVGTDGSEVEFPIRFVGHRPMPIYPYLRDAITDFCRDFSPYRPYSGPERALLWSSVGVLIAVIPLLSRASGPFLGIVSIGLVLMAGTVAPIYLEHLMMMDWSRDNARAVLPPRTPSNLANQQ